MLDKIREAIKNKDYENAIANCKLIIEQNKGKQHYFDTLSAKAFLGIIFTRQGKYAESFNIFEPIHDDLIKYHSEKWPGNELVTTYLYFNKASKALEYNTAFLKHHSGNSNALITQGQLLYQINEFSAAEKTLKAAIKIEPESAQAYFTLAHIFLKQGNKKKAFQFFEISFNMGYKAAIYQMLKLLFTRTGKCDYLNCTNTCCKNVIIHGIDGKPISNKNELDVLVFHDPKQQCWYKKGVRKNGNWLFNCTNNTDNNTCKDYKNRPELCKDYPSHPLVMRNGCTYEFILNTNFRFTTQSCFHVMCEILQEYHYHEQVGILKARHT